MSHHSFDIQVTLHDSDDIGDVAWPDTPHARLLQRYWAPLVTDGLDGYTRNCGVTPALLHVRDPDRAEDDLWLPVVVAEPGASATWVTSLETQHVDYSREELFRMVGGPAWKRIAIRGLFSSIRPLFRAGAIDRTVQVNNWLFSTNLYPEGMTDAHVAAITDHLRKRFPRHAIVFRSISPEFDPDLYASLERAGYAFWLSRQILHVDTAAGTLRYRHRRHIRVDVQTFIANGYRVLSAPDMAPETYDDMARLYNLLYLGKYNPYSTSLTPRYVALLRDTAHADTPSEFEVAVDGAGAVVGWQFEYRVGRRVFAPFIGLDPGASRDAGTYGGLTGRGYQRAIERGLWLHASAGVAAFKRHRGCQPGIDYHALFIDHLPQRRRAFYRALIALYSNQIARGLVAQHAQEDES